MRNYRLCAFSKSIVWTEGTLIGTVASGTSEHEELMDSGVVSLPSVEDLELANKHESLAALSKQKLEAFEYKGVSCSVKESDQNGWTVVDKRVKELLAIGTEWRTIYFQMENGNVIPLETQAEWEEFYNLCWDNRERLMNEKAQILMNM